MLNRIEAKNFKSFKHLDYKCSKLNLLTGLNGAGKSSVVQLMLLLRAIADRVGKCQIDVDLQKIRIAKSFGDIRYCYAAKDEPTSVSVSFPEVVLDGDGDMFDGPKQMIGSWRITKSATSRHNAILWHPDALEEYERYENKERATLDSLFEEKIGEEESGGILQREEEALSAGISKIEKDLVRLQGQYRNVCGRIRFVEAFRKKPQDVHDGRGIELASVLFGSVEFDPEGGDVVEFLHRAGTKVYLRKENPMVHDKGKIVRDRRGDISLLIDQVNAWLGEVSPGARFHSECVEAWDDESFVAQIGFGAGPDEKKFKPQNVGLGISYVLPVLVALLTARPRTIVVIENPEAHIHPRGQVKLGELIAKAAAYGVQVFVETHSDHIINGVRVAVRDGILKPEDVNIAFFDRKEQLKSNAIDDADTEIYSEVRNIKVDANGALSEYPEDFMDEWNNQLMELMRS